MSPPREPPEYTVYRARRRLFGRDDDDSITKAVRGDHEPGRRAPRVPRRLTGRRVAGYLLLAVLGWIALSVLLFMVSAQIQQGQVSSAADRLLGGAGYPLTSANNILVLGSDRRTESTAEPGSSTSGPSRADTILLMRAGGGASSKLSIPRDTLVDIPGHGRNKINAAYAIGGVALAIETVESYTGIDIHHVIEVSFENFPEFIDALGGIDMKTGCVVSRINGGFRNGGFTLRLRPGENHLNGKQALALARTRKNDCNSKENDLTRARRQQKILSAIRSRLTSPTTFFRLPWVSWKAPEAIRSDMSGPSLLGLFGATTFSDDAKTRVLKPSGGETLPDGGAGLVVSDAEKQAEVRRFLRG